MHEKKSSPEQVETAEVAVDGSSSGQNAHGGAARRFLEKMNFSRNDKAALCLNFIKMSQNFENLLPAGPEKSNRRIIKHSPTKI